MKKKTNRKGFTLVELLAVIVILAILILLAMPTALRIMADARKDAFAIEAQSIISAAQTAYVTEGRTGATCFVYSGAAAADSDLADYVDVKSAYRGEVNVTIDGTTGSPIFTITLFNGTGTDAYKITGVKDALDGDDVTTGTAAVSADFTCS
jgi:prepilin-type N-terminal cleavage/methylation domain-containing protein